MFRLTIRRHLISIWNS